jgi:hypothetical protein
MRRCYCCWGEQWENFELRPFALGMSYVTVVFKRLAMRSDDLLTFVWAVYHFQYATL